MQDVIGLPLRPKMDLPSHKTVVFSATCAAWKTSASLTAASGPVVSILWLVACVADMLASCLPKLVSNSPNVKPVLFLSLFTATVIRSILYPMARTFLVVKCFISLRKTQQSGSAGAENCSPRTTNRTTKATKLQLSFFASTWRLRIC